MDSSIVVTGTVGVLVFLFQLWVFIKALTFPARAWEDANVSRPLWLTLLVLSFFISVCGLFLTVYFWFSPMTQIKRQLKLGGRPGFPGGR